MTSTVPNVAPPTDEGKRSRRRLIAGAVALIVLAAGVVVLGMLRHLDHQYGPLRQGSFGGPFSDRGFVFDKDGFSYHLADAPGATAQLISSLDDLGAHSVKITSIETGDMASDIRWSVYRFLAGVSITGAAAPWHEFPAIVPAHGTIRLLITLRHPSNCAAYPRDDGVSETRYFGAHLVHWESLLHSHVSLVRIFSADDGIRVC